MSKMEKQKDTDVKTTIQNLKQMDTGGHTNTYNNGHRNENKHKHIDIAFFMICVMIVNCLQDVVNYLTNKINTPNKTHNQHYKSHTMIAVQIAKLKGNFGSASKKKGRKDNSVSLSQQDIEEYYKPFVEANQMTDQKKDTKVKTSQTVVDYIVTMIKPLNQDHIYRELCLQIDFLRSRHPNATKQELVFLLYEHFTQISPNSASHPANFYDILKVATNVV